MAYTDFPIGKFEDIFKLGNLYTHIFPVKQKVLYNFLKKLSMKGIHEIWVFGSALTYCCSQYSDLDIAIIGDVDKIDLKSLLRVRKGDIDIVEYSADDFYSNIDTFDSLEYNIFRKGIKIYDRKNSPNTG